MEKRTWQPWIYEALVDLKWASHLSGKHFYSLRLICVFSGPMDESVDCHQVMDLDDFTGDTVEHMVDMRWFPQINPKGPKLKFIDQLRADLQNMAV